MRNSEWSGTGTVIVPVGLVCCITTWLPRCRIRTNPFWERLAQTSRPESTRSLPNGDLETRDVDLLVQPRLDFLG